VKVIMRLYQNGVEVRVRYNSALKEYSCDLYVRGQKNEDATYYTNDREDAIATADHMVKNSK